MSNRCTETAKDKVKKVHPSAFTKQSLLSGDWCVYVKRGSGTVEAFARGFTAKAAWQRAAEKL